MVLGFKTVSFYQTIYFMSFQKASGPCVPKSLPTSNPSSISCRTNNQPPLLDQEVTIQMDSKQKPDCKYCVLKQKLVLGSIQGCLTHTIRAASNQIDQHLSNNMPTYKQLAVSSHHQPIPIDELSMNALNRQAQELYNSIKKVQLYIDTSASPFQNQMLSTLTQCIELLKKKYVKLDDKQNNTSYTISLQLDVSNDLTEWLQILLEGSYSNLEQEGLLPEMNGFMNSLQEWNTKRIPELFVKLMDSIQQKFDLNHMMLKQYQMSMNQMNKRLLSYMQKVPANGIKQLQDDLNFIEHVSSLGEITTSRNVSNNSSLMVKRKSFEDQDTENDLLRFVLLQAAALQKKLPKTLDTSTFD